MARRALTFDVNTQLTRDMSTDDLILLAQEEQELREQNQLLEEMCPKLREKFDQIRDLIEAEFHAVLRNRYELGTIFRSIYDDETDNGAKIYGQHAVENICRLLGINRNLVNSCMRFADLYSRDDLEELSTRLLPRGEHISWSHVKALVHVDDEKKREELLERTFDEGLTCVELADAIKSEGDHDDNNGGRPLKVHATFEGIVRQQLKATEDWERRNQRVWDHPKHSLIVKAEEVPEEEVTQEMLQEASELAHRLRGLAQEANKAAGKAEDVVRRFQCILDERSKPQVHKDEKHKAAKGHDKKSNEGKRKPASVAK